MRNFIIGLAAVAALYLMAGGIMLAPLLISQAVKILFHAIGGGL